jgi:sec-independent protein translocase protein TatA
MGQLGFQEIFVIFIIALLIFGPRKLPELGKSLGKGLREFKRATEDLKSSWDQQMRDAENEIKDVKNTIEQAEDLNKSAPVETATSSEPSTPEEQVIPKEKD